MNSEVLERRTSGKGHTANTCRICKTFLSPSAVSSVLQRTLTLKIQYEKADRGVLPSLLLSVVPSSLLPSVVSEIKY